MTQSIGMRSFLPIRYMRACRIVFSQVWARMVLSTVMVFALCQVMEASASDFPFEVEYLIEGGPDSVISIYVPRAGALRFLGHDHTIEVRTFSGMLSIPGEGPEAGWLQLKVEADGIVVTDGEASEKRREEVRVEAIGPKVLAVETYPLVQYKSTAIEVLDDGNWRLEGELEIRGNAREVTFEARVQFDSSQTLQAEGKLLLKPSEFGINPVSALAGTIRTADEIELSFSVLGIPVDAERTVP